MNCWHCNTELIWGGDHDIYIQDGYNFDGIVTVAPGVPLATNLRV